LEEKEYAKLFQTEETYWWNVSLRKKIFKFLGKAGLASRKDLRILDAGCGTGILLKELGGLGNAEGIDFSDTALGFCRKRKLAVKKASIDSLPFKDKSFDLVTAINVIYHRNVEDRKAIGECYRVLKKDGFFLVNESAFSSLYSAHDRAIQGARRHTKKEIENMVSEAGFKIVRSGYWTSLLFPAVAVARLAGKLVKEGREESDLKETSQLVNSLLVKLMDFESWLLDFLPLPFGIGIIVVAQKK